jgi:hypothetical protein
VELGMIFGFASRFLAGVFLFYGNFAVHLFG